MRNSRTQHKNGASKGRRATVERDDFNDDVDALFRLPLAEFTGARNTLAALLKKAGRRDEAVLVKALAVKALAKPSISAWAVNQLYWNHREEFDRLIASGERFHKAQASRAGGKVAEMRAALDTRRKVLTDLSDLATSLLRDAGQNPSLDTLRRVTTTLEAMSAMSDWASRSDAPRPGRLTHDVDPPGFESFAAFVPSARMTQPAKERAREPARVTPSQKSTSAATNTRRKVELDDSVRQLEETRKTKIAAAKVSLKDAKRSLTEARARAQSLAAAQKKADAEAKKAEKHRRDAEASLQKANAAAEVAAHRARSVAVEIEAAAGAVEDAERRLEKASKEFEALFRES